MSEAQDKTKQCTRCGEYKALSEFSKKAAAKDGMQAWCKKCQNAAGLAWAKANLEKVCARSLVWQKAHSEKHCAKQQRRRALKLNASGDHTDDDTKALYDAQEGRCAYCGRNVSQGYHVDHVVPLSRGGSNGPENLALTCAKCNCSKGDKLLREWIDRPSAS